jgi:hypothetical protein
LLTRAVRMDTEGLHALANHDREGVDVLGFFIILFIVPGRGKSPAAGRLHRQARQGLG